MRFWKCAQIWPICTIIACEVIFVSAQLQKGEMVELEICAQTGRAPNKLVKPVISQTLTGLHRLVRLHLPLMDKRQHHSTTLHGPPVAVLPARPCPVHVCVCGRAWKSMWNVHNEISTHLHALVHSCSSRFAAVCHSKSNKHWFFKWGKTLYMH